MSGQIAGTSERTRRGQKFRNGSPDLKGVRLLEAYSLLCRGKLPEFLAKFKAGTAIDAREMTLSHNYMDFNQSAISFYRCMPGLGFINLFKPDPQVYWSLVADYRQMIPRFPGFGPLTAGEFYYETDRKRLYDTWPPLSMRRLRLSAPEVPAMATVARIKRSQNEITAAFDAIRECEKRLAQINRPHWNYLLNAFKTRLDLDTGRTDAASEWLTISKLHIYQEITKTGEYELLVFAR